MYKGTKFHTLLYCLMLSIFSLSTTVVAASNTKDIDLEAFFNNIMDSKVEKYHIPNATVSVVKDGLVVYKKGFGFADMEKSLPVNADTTLFRIGSTSKLITWTAVMQLVEAGKLDLNADINTYLDFKIPEKLDGAIEKTTTEPITMTHLMTHTPGFEDYPGMLFRLSKDELLPLNEYIKDCLPKRIFPAGEVAAYSNYGTALAGYVVERVSGLPFSEYIEKNIFAPLNMDKSTFRQPPSFGSSACITKSYRYIHGAYVEGSFEYVLPEPAGSMSTTASDMANFMLAHLTGGAYGKERILMEETLNKMHRQHFTYDPDLGGMTLGFMEGVFNDKYVLFHNGGTMLYNTCLYLLPEVETGIFISYSGGNHLLHSEVFQEFLDFYYPISAQATVGVPSEGSKERSKKFVGEYQMNRRSLNTDEKINSILGGGIINVDIDEDGYLLVTNVGETNKFFETDSGVYQNLREGRTQDYFGNFHKIVFRTDPYGKIMLTTDGPLTYSKAPFYSTMGFTVIVALINMLIIVISLVHWIIIKLIGAFKRSKNKKLGLPSITQWFGIFASISVLILIVTIFSSGGIDPVYQLPQVAYMPVEGNSFLGFMSTFMLLSSCLLVFLATIVWHKGFWRWISRIHYSVFTLAFLGLMWLFNYWNLFN